MNKEAERALTRARTQLLFSHGFFGALALRLRLTEDESIKTLNVDGKTIRYNPEFILSLDNDVRMAAMAHEVMHCVLDHMSRLSSREPRRWNRATDYAINQMLQDAGMTLGDGWLIAPQFKGMSADEIYPLLPDDPEEESMDDMSSGSGGPAQAVEWQIAAAQAAQTVAAQGKLPGSLQRFLEEVGKPKVDWRAYLRRFVTERSKNDYSWSRPQRRFLAQGLVLPGLYSESMGCMVAVSDDSGSVGDDMLKALSTEIDAIASACTPQRLMHISCDCEINHVGEFGPDEKFVMTSKGGGGTDFRPPFEYIKEQSVRPACLVYLTDGYGPFPETAPDYPVLWCMTTEVIPPWGEHVRIEL